MEILVLI